MDPVLHFWEVLAFTVPWAAVAGVMGVASVFASTWLTNQREQREAEQKKRRFERVVDAVNDLHERMGALEQAVADLGDDDEGEDVPST